MNWESYRPDIDGLRAVAIAGVVTYHAFPQTLRGGFTGVDVFFVISGYLISRLIWGRLEAGTFTLRDFYRRRAVRLFPALTLVLFVSLVAGWFVLAPSAFSTLGSDVVAAATYRTNIVLWHSASNYFAPSASLRPLTHLWSLAVEEQFYLLYPLLLIGLARHRRAAGFVLCALFLASFGISLYQSAHSATAAYYLLPARFWELLAGGLIVYFRVSLAPAWGFVGGALIVLGLIGPTSTSLFPGYWALAPVIGTSLVIASRGPMTRVLSCRPLVGLGLISYALYLWHYPILVFARVRYPSLSPSRTMLLTALSLVLAYATYRFVERPIQHRRWNARAWRASILASVLAFTGALGVTVDAFAGVPTRVSFSLQQLESLPNRYVNISAWRMGKCFLNPDQGPSDFRQCVSSGPAPLVALWGDSHAAALYPGLAALHGNFRLAEFTASSCPPVIGYADPTTRPFCASIDTYVANRIKKLHPQEVILSGAWGGYEYPGAPIRFSIAMIAHTVAALKAAGIKKIVLVGDVPWWNEPLPQVLWTYAESHDGAIPKRTNFELSENEELGNVPIRGVAKQEHVRYVDPIPVLCNSNGCMTRVGPHVSDLESWDDAHLTIPASRYLVGKLATQLILVG